MQAVCQLCMDEPSSHANATLSMHVQAGDDNHEVAMDFMLRGLEHHRYADINPLHVDQSYAGYG